MNISSKVKSIWNTATEKATATAGEIANKAKDIWGSPRGRVITIASGSLLATAIIAGIIISNIPPTKSDSMVKPEVSAVNLATVSDSSTDSSMSSADSSSVASASSAAPSSPASESSGTTSVTSSKSNSGVKSGSSTTSGKTGDNKGDTTNNQTGGNQGDTTNNQTGGNKGDTTNNQTGGNQGDTTNNQTGGNQGNTDANYQGTNETLHFTDDVTGISQTVQFLGVGAGHKMVAGGNASINTTSAMGTAHFGLATAKLKGSNGVTQTSPEAVIKDGNDGTFTISNLTAGTYEVQLVAHDNVIVTQYHFTVDSSGNVH